MEFENYNLAKRKYLKSDQKQANTNFMLQSKIIWKIA